MDNHALPIVNTTLEGCNEDALFYLVMVERIFASLSLSRLFFFFFTCMTRLEIFLKDVPAFATFYYFAFLPSSEGANA